MATSTTVSGVEKSGSPTAKLKIFLPVAASSAALLLRARVGDGDRLAMRCENSRSIVLI